MEMKSVPGIKRHELQMFFAFLTKQGEQLVKQERRGDHGWPGIMAKAAPFKHLGTAPDFGQPFNQGNAVAFCAHPQRRGNAAKAAAHNNCMWGCVRGERAGIIHLPPPYCLAGFASA